MKPLEHDIVRPWKCCTECRNRYERERRKIKGRPQSMDRLKQTARAEKHDDRIDELLRVLYG